MKLWNYDISQMYKEEVNKTVMKIKQIELESILFQNTRERYETR